MAEYTGSRRAPSALTDVAFQRAFAEDDAAVTCPSCGAFVRSDQQWCTLCLHVLHQPEPEPEPEPEPDPTPQPEPQRAALAADQPAALTEQPAEPTSAPVVAGSNPEAEAAADALLAQLAVQSRQEGLQLPPFLQSKGQRTLAIAIAMGVFATVAVVLLTVLGAILN